MNPANTGPQPMTASHHAPPAGRQHRPRRKSLEQLEAKYKALMRNMLMYQQMRKRNMAGGTGAGTGAKTEVIGPGGRMGDKSQQQQQHLMYQAQQTLPTPSSSVSPVSSVTNIEDGGISKQNQPQQQSAHHQHQHHSHQHHQNPTPAVREQHRERPPQKRLQNVSSGPKSAYDRRDTGSSARHVRPPGRSMPAAVQLAYEELASMQRNQTPPPHHHQQQQQNQFQQPTQQQQHPGSAPIPIPRPTNIQIPPHYLQQQYMHHVSPHIHAHHQPLASPLPTPPHLTASYNGHHGLPTISAPYYDASGMSAHMDQQQHQHQHQHQHQQQHHAHHHPQQGLPSFETTGNVEGDLLDCFVSNMGEI
ncbi:hypothetical protein GGS24DRAFT_493383 [Hypoxylon argillaceum]|nr:hypothetical protein GGS24DRAFT_493383 [Hypoxylon argillaceum]